MTVPETVIADGNEHGERVPVLSAHERQAAAVNKKDFKV